MGDYMIIYKIKNKANKKEYVGQTTQDLEYRWKAHCNKGSNCKILKAAINKYGEESFIIEKIEECHSQDTLNEREEFWIKKLNSLAPNGYNLMTGGAAPRHSEITKQKMSETRKGKHPHWATEASRSEEARAKRAESHRGQKRSKETIARMKEVQGKRCRSIRDQNGKVYRSTGDAAKELNLSRGNICMVLSGQRRTTGGFSFRYVK
jgi:group I intron endonuclease